MDDPSLDHVRSYVRRTQKKAVIVGTVLALVLRFLWSKPIAVGFLAGTVVSIINFQLMSTQALKSGQDENRLSDGRTIFRYLLRYFLIFGSFTALAQSTQFNIFAAFFGLFFVQAMLITWQFVSSLHLFPHSPNRTAR